MGRGGAPREEKETEKRSKEKEEETDGRGRGGEIEALDKRVVGWSRRGWQGETGKQQFPLSGAGWAVIMRNKLPL